MESFGSKSNGAKPLGFPERASDEPGLNGPEKRRVDTHGQIVTCAPDQLRPHPSYVRHQLTVPAHQLSTLASSSDLAFQDPLVITRDLLILDGYARWELARKQGRPTLLCIAYDMTEADALHWLLQRHRRSAGLNDYCRILLALDLEPSLKEKARANQQAGGRGKASSKLTEAERPVDVRSEIAAAAGVSAANVTKVKQLIRTAPSGVLNALRNGEISIHRAWLWSKEPREAQQRALWLYQSKRGAVRDLNAWQRSTNSPAEPDPAHVLRCLSKLAPSHLSSVIMAVLNTPGKAVFVTAELLEALGSQEELPLTCATNIR